MDAPVVRFFVPGVPAPGGSKKAFAFVGKDGRPRANVVDDAKGNADWRACVALAARRAMRGDEPLGGPLRFVMTFVVPRPKGHFGTGRNAAKLRPSAPAHPTSKPDVTKLVRSTEDALKGVAWADDCQVVRQTAWKEYGARPGAWVSIYRMD